MYFHGKSGKHHVFYAYVCLCPCKVQKRAVISTSRHGPAAAFLVFLAAAAGAGVIAANAGRGLCGFWLFGLNLAGCGIGKAAVIIVMPEFLCHGRPFGFRAGFFLFRAHNLHAHPGEGAENSLPNLSTPSLLFIIL